MTIEINGIEELEKLETEKLELKKTINRLREELQIAIKRLSYIKGIEEFINIKVNK